ncbi:MAG: DUF349 domain-containing protein [Ekhidna sp.]
MDNEEKLQEVTDQKLSETPEEVQSKTESSIVKEPETPEKEELGVDEKLDDLQDASDSEEVSIPLEEDKIEEVAELSSVDTEENGIDSSEDGGEEHEEEELDFDEASREELIEKIKEIRNEDDLRKVDKILKAVKPRFDDLFEMSKNAALETFVAEGNEADSFEYHGDELDKEFFSLYRELRSKRNKFFKDLENQKEDNLKKKERLLDEIRQVVDGEESTNSINSIRDLQAEWKKTGPVPGAQNKTLWANYNALLDRYYDNRSIYFELKDLDRKKNLTQKQELCVKAEELAKMEDMKVAIVQLNELHDEYKHIGPVPKDDQEPTWQRFKAASDAIYENRKEYFDQLKVEFDANLVKKEELIKEVEDFLNFNSERISDWNKKTKALLELQKKWEAIGGVARDKAKSINRNFWNSFKGFFANKNKFFKELESHREENLAKKEELIKKADEIKDNEDWNATSDKLKQLQSQWKDIGPVPEKVRNSTYEKFKTACDHFFERRREQNKEQFKSYEENLKLKLKICDQLEGMSTATEGALDDIYDMIDNYTAIGFVPKNAINKTQKRFEEVTRKVLANEAIDEIDRQDLRSHIQTGRLRNTPGGDRKAQRKEHSIKRKITALEGDINTWNTNIEFFASSATADKLKQEMQQRINSAKSELEGLKSQLKSL